MSELSQPRPARDEWFDAAFLMVVARSEHAYSVLKQAFRDREVDKTYHALVQGHPDPLRGTVDAPIEWQSISRRPTGSCA